MALTTGEHDHAALHSESPDDAIGAAVRTLRGHGERVTSARLAVLTALAGRTEELAADDVVDMLVSSGVHRATVYRTLDLLTDVGVVLRRHSPNGSATYHLVTTATGREHLHGRCRSCLTLVSLPADALDGAVGTIQQRTGFLLEAAQSTLSGVCERCAVASGAQSPSTQVAIRK